MPDTEETIMQTRLDVAEIKGMLTQVISSHDARLNAHDVRLDSHDNRLNEKKAVIARHDERIKDLEDDNSARLGRITGTIGLIISGLVAGLAILNSLRIGV